MNIERLAQLARTAAKSEKVRKVARVARVAASSGPVRELATICGRAGMAGAIVDGGMGGVHAAKAVRDGRLDAAGAAKHVGAEAGCGFVTSSAGTAGTIAIYMVTGSMGPLALAAGMGASLGARYAYRAIVGETLPPEQVAPKEERAGDEDPIMEEIGPEDDEL